MIFYNYTIYNGKVYSVYYDKENNKTRFFLDDKEASGEDLLALNKKYNTLKGLRLSGKGKLLVGILSATIALGVYSGLYDGIGENEPVYKDPTYVTEEYVEDDSEEYIDEEYEEEYETEDEAIEEAYDPENFYDDLYEASGDNKEFVSMMEKPIRDNMDHMLYRDLLNTIDDLEIVEGETEAMKENSTIMAQYEDTRNRITYREDVDSYYLDETLKHEAFHYLSQSGFCKTNSLFDGYIGNALNEGMTQQLVKEYYNGSSNIYPVEVAYCCALTEIVGSEFMREAYFTNNLDLIIDRLSEYVDEDEALSLLKNMDDASVNYDYYINSMSSDDLINFNNNNEVIWEIMDKAYYRAFGKEMYDDKIMLTYMSGTCLEDKVNDKVEGILYVSFNKGYFNDEYIEDIDGEYIIKYYTAKDGLFRDYLSESERMLSSSSKSKQ